MRWLGRLGWMALGALLLLVAGIAFHILSRPPLQPWHRVRLREELVSRGGAAARRLSDYLALEERLFTELERELLARIDRFPTLSRFDPSSPTHPGRLPGNWNRSVTLGPDRSARGGALLLHGLSDSPYSLRAVGERLAREGFAVVIPRLPGHGTVPGGLTTATWEDWRAVVRLGVQAARERAEQAAPLVIVGYSNGAALALDFALDALDEPGLPDPDRLLFFSPAIAVSKAAGLAGFVAMAARVPGLGPLAWDAILPEYDPYKYNSFPTRAAAEIHRLTSSIEKRLERLEASGRSGELPPVLTFQSVVDATVPPITSLRRLYSRLHDSASELVLFDANRLAALEDFLSPEADALLRLAQPGQPFDFRVTLVTNAAADSVAVVARSRAPGSTQVEEEALGLSWPAGVYSLSHVAVPFPPEDPVYGLDRSLGPPFPFGALEPRGERGLLLVPPELLMRLRYNPFYSYLESRVIRFVS